MSQDKKTDDKNIHAWQGRMRGALLELAILYMSAFLPEELYPYNIRKRLVEKWKDKAPPLPTIYSTIDRLENNGFIKLNSSIQGGRVKKSIKIVDPLGWDALEQMMADYNEFATIFEYHEHKDVKLPDR